MLNNIQNDLRELINLVRESATYDALLFASYSNNDPIIRSQESILERTKKTERITQLINRYDL